MTAGDDSLFVTVGGKDIGLEALLKKVDAEMQQSADQAVRLGQSYARLAQAQGQPAAASQILAGTMQRAGAASERSIIGLATQQANLANSSRNLTATVAGLGSQLGQLGGTAGQIAGSFGQLAGSFGTLGAVGAAIGLGKVAVDLSVAGANADLVRTRFDGLAASAHTTGDALLGALQKASGGEINNLNLQLAANRAQILGVAKSAEEMSVLLAIARDRAQQLGTSSAKAFDDLVTGLGRGSPLILDNLGIMVSVKEANAQYAASLGKTASALTEAEQKQALINAVLAQGRASLQATGGAVESAAGTFQQLGAAAENAESSIGQLGAEILKLPAQKAVNILVTVSGNLDILAGATDQLQKFSERAFTGAQSFADYGSRVAQVNAQLAPFGTNIKSLSAESYNYAQSLIATGTSAQDAFNKALRYSGVVDQIAAAQQAAGGSGGTWATALSSLGERAAEVAAQSDTNRVAVEGLTQAYLAGGISSDQFGATLAILEARHLQAASAAAQDALETQRLGVVNSTAAQQVAALGQSLVDETTKKLNSAQAAQQLAQFQSTLASLGGAVANGMQTAGSAAAALANQYHIAYAAALQLINAQAALAQAKVNAAALSSQRSGERNPGSSGVAEAAAQEQARLNAIYKRLVVPAPKPPKGGAGGGTRLSDEQKLNNSLLASQEEYQTKSEDAATQHAIDVEKIYQDFYQKMQSAQRDFDQSQLEGRAGFYDNLGQIESDKIRQAASAQYEQASIEAGKIAETQGADVAEKYMDAQERIISARAKRLAEIEKAEKDKDSGRAEYLRGVDAEYKKAEDAKLARIKEGEGSLSSERDKQLAESAAKEQDAQDKIGLAADRAAEKKILASERAGKAIDTELAKAGQLADTYDRVGQSSSRAGITPVPAGAAAGTPTTPAQAAAAAAAPVTNADAMLAAIEGLKQAIAAVERATTAGADKVAGAVRVRMAS
jgi:hypothetical protein